MEDICTIVQSLMLLCEDSSGEDGYKLTVGCARLVQAIFTRSSILAKPNVWPRDIRDVLGSPLDIVINKLCQTANSRPESAPTITSIYLYDCAATIIVIFLHKYHNPLHLMEVLDQSSFIPIASEFLTLNVESYGISTAPRRQEREEFLMKMAKLLPWWCREENFSTIARPDCQVIALMAHICLLSLDWDKSHVPGQCPIFSSALYYMDC